MSSGAAPASFSSLTTRPQLLRSVFVVGAKPKTVTSASQWPLTARGVEAGLTGLGGAKDDVVGKAEAAIAPSSDAPEALASVFSLESLFRFSLFNRGKDALPIIGSIGKDALPLLALIGSTSLPIPLALIGKASLPIISSQGDEANCQRCEALMRYS